MRLEFKAVIFIALMLFPTLSIINAQPLTINIEQSKINQGNMVETDLSLIDQSIEEMTQTLIEKAEDLKRNVEELFENLDEKEIDVPESAYTSYYRGVDALENAKKLFEEKQYNEAAKKVTESLAHLGVVYVEELNLLSDDDDIEAGEDLPEALERAYKYWKRLNSTVTRLEEDGENVSDIREILDEVKDMLDEVYDLLSQGKYFDAREIFPNARSTLGSINVSLMDHIKLRKQKQAEKFLQDFQLRIESLNVTLKSFKEHLEEQKATSLFSALTSSSSLLSRLRQRFTGDDFDEALDDLEDVIEELDFAISDINGDIYSIQLRQVYEYEAKIQAFNRTIEWRSNRNIDTNEYEQYLEEFKDRLDEIKILPNREEVEEFMDDLKDKFESFKDDFRSSNRESILERILEQIRNKLEGHNRNAHENSEGS